MHASYLTPSPWTFVESDSPCVRKSILPQSHLLKGQHYVSHLLGSLGFPFRFVPNFTTAAITCRLLFHLEAL